LHRRDLHEPRETKGASLKDPKGLFNAGLDGNVRRAIDIHEGDKVNEAALKDLIRAAVALNLKGKSKPKPRRASRSGPTSAVPTCYVYVLHIRFAQRY